ncbi:MAG: glutamate-5-semialdehyde dehydrogenase [Candidatus Omnitrophica bacterium]|nr:glutamate-5-semialdehyde dehydrogenase [Candidatus Omnitrophota bacterium]
MSTSQTVKKLAQKAKQSSIDLAGLSSGIKNKALIKMAESIAKNSLYIFKENKKDLQKAEQSGLGAAFIDRLRLDSRRIKEMADSLKEIARLSDPVGEIIRSWQRPNGLRINKVRTPIGVIAIIYESRPNVTSDCVGLCLKTGNAIILRGGSEAFNSNKALYNLMTHSSAKLIPKGAVQFVPTTDRKALNYLLSLNNYVDLLIPRGGESLIKYVYNKSKIPVIKHYKGVCHIYVDQYADTGKALKICYNAKVQRPGVCNAMESLLVHKKIAVKFLVPMAEMFRDAGVELRGCAKSKKILPWIKSAKESDYYKEYLDLVLSVKIVDSVDSAIKHVYKYGSSHSDSIITEEPDAAFKFLNRVDSACVYLNASTRFTDGYQFGLGAEMGISTDKIHARGPMALEELTTYKYVIFGNGQIRS